MKLTLADLAKLETAFGSVQGIMDAFQEKPIGSLYTALQTIGWSDEQIDTITELSVIMGDFVKAITGFVGGEPVPLAQHASDGDSES